MALADSACHRHRPQGRRTSTKGQTSLPVDPLTWRHARLDGHVTGLDETVSLVPSSEPKGRLALALGRLEVHHKAMTHHKGWVIAALAVLLAPGGATARVSSAAAETPATTPSAEPQTERLTVDAPSLDGNLLGDPSEVEIEVADSGLVRNVSRASLPSGLLPRRL